MSITHQQLRQLFKNFWQKKNHKEIPPISLVPQNDSTTLFTGFGMQPLVPYLLGESHPLGDKLYNIQSCFRSQDIEEVGDNRHTTFFEMMGNWSLGDYFKEEQLEWFWIFLTKELNFSKDKLYISTFKGSKDIPKDKESLHIWKKLGVSDNHIFQYGPEKNWWSRAGVPENMPAGEPGGPDSEVFFDFGGKLKFHEKSKFKDRSCHPNCDCGRFSEIGNNVFIQFKKNTNGSFSELPAKNVDFGGGLERILTALNNNPDIFKIDIFSAIISEIESSSQGLDYMNIKLQPKIRVIADHIRGAVFMIHNGIEPNNKDRGYVLRRLIRRSVVKMRELNIIPSEVIPKICNTVFNIYEKIYFDGKSPTDFTRIITKEADSFLGSLNKGIKVLQNISNIDGKAAFDLYQSYGFPLEITEEILLEQGRKIDKKQFYAEFQKHKNLSRSASSAKFKGGLADQSKQTIKYHTVTHLLHQALFNELGQDIRQEGSNITNERLRFDFYSSTKPVDDQIKKIETAVNQKIQESLTVFFKILPKEEALKLGAKSFFREKYPDLVKVYFIGNYSKEFCAGPHVANTGKLGKFEIFKFEKIGSSLYRIYAR